MTRSRFSSPAMVTSNRGMFGPLFVFFENNHAAQIRRSVRIKSLLQSSVETHQLTREHIRRQARIFRQIRFQLDSEIGRCLRAAFDSVGDHQSDSPESFDFLKHSSLPPSEAARYCTASNIDVNERVITVLRSSARGNKIDIVAISSSFCSVVQLIAMLGIFSWFKYRATFKTSDVFPEREIRTGAKSWVPAKIRSENNKSSEAGIARARTQVIAGQLAAPAITMR